MPPRFPSDHIHFREGGGAREDRLRHRWRLLQIAEKTGRSVEEAALRLGLKRSVLAKDFQAGRD